MHGTRNVNVSGADMIAVSDKAGDLAGASTWFQLNGYVDALDLRIAGGNRGIAAQHMPQDTTAKTALRRACADQIDKRTLSRSLPGGGWAIVKELTQGATLVHQVVLRCTVDATEKLVIRGEEGTGYSENGPLAESIKVAFDAHLTRLNTDDISGWLVRTAERLGAVALRDRGGVYFVPRHALQEWRNAVEALRSVAPTCDVFELPTLKSSEAIRSIVAAITREAEQMAQELLEKIQNGELGVRALKARQTDCDALCDKLAAYEGLLGASLAKVTEQIQGVASTCAATALLIAGQDDAASQGA